MATHKNNLNVGDIVGGVEDQYGITLHVLKEVKEDVSQIGFDFYPANDPNFNWAVEELQKWRNDDL